MQDSTEVANDIKVHKQVSFAGEVKDREYTPLKKLKSHPSCTLMKKRVFAFLSKDQFPELSSYLSAFPTQVVNDFFKNEGKVFFSWAITGASTSGALEFLIQNLPGIIVDQNLCYKDCAIIEGFLDGQCGMEKRGMQDLAEKALAVEKIKLLLAIGNPEITDYIKTHVGDGLRVAIRKSIGPIV